MENSNGYREKITIGISKVYYYSILSLIPIGVLLILPYFLVWGNEISKSLVHLLSRIKSDWSKIFFYLDFLKDFSLMLLVMIFGALIHELLHGFSWILLARKKINTLKIGITVQDMSPYIHCKVSLPVWVYRIGIVLPGIVLGILPATIGLILGHVRIFAFGLFFTWAATGDFVMLWLIRHLKNSDYVRDHSKRIGCYVL